MTIASMFLRSIMCHLQLSIIMGSPHGTHFLKKFYQSKIISKIQKGSLKWMLQLRVLVTKTCSGWYLFITLCTTQMVVRSAWRSLGYCTRWRCVHNRPVDLNETSTIQTPYKDINMRAIKGQNTSMSLHINFYIYIWYKSRWTLSTRVIPIFWAYIAFYAPQLVNLSQAFTS